MKAAAEAISKLAGARIQRVDRVLDKAISLEVRIPGTTRHLVLSAEGRLGAFRSARRPEKRSEGGELQRFLRKRLAGAGLLGAEASDAELVLRLDRGLLRLLPRARAGWIRFDEARAEVGALRAEPGVDLELPEFESGTTQRLARRDEVLARVRAEQKRIRRLVAKVEQDLERARRLEAEALRGELLKAHLHAVRRGMDAVDVIDYATGDTVRIPLDPKLDGVQNLQKIFARAKKGARGAPIAAERLSRARSELDRLDGEVQRWTRADPDAVATLPEPKLRAPRAKPDRLPEIDRLTRRFVAEDGAEIRVGKNARGNDRLSTGARAHDLWFHARGVPGAHVVLRIEAGQAASPESVLDAAHLAIHFSEAAREAKAEVIQAEARHVKKTKGAAPGAVGVAKSRTLLVGIERVRLDRLLGRGGHEEV